jgi:hypothetical protein
MAAEFDPVKGRRSNASLATADCLNVRVEKADR